MTRNPPQIRPEQKRQYSNDALESAPKDAFQQTDSQETESTEKVPARIPAADSVCEDQTMQSGTPNVAQRTSGAISVTEKRAATSEQHFKRASDAQDRPIASSIRSPSLPLPFPRRPAAAATAAATTAATAAASTPPAAAAATAASKPAGRPTTGEGTSTAPTKPGRPL